MPRSYYMLFTHQSGRLSVIIAPPSLPRLTPTPPPAPPHLDALEKRLLEILGYEGELPITALLNCASTEQNPETREEGRKLWRKPGTVCAACCV